jgi:hypothetical protein
MRPLLNTSPVGTDEERGYNAARNQHLMDCAAALTSGSDSVAHATKLD